MKTKIIFCFIAGILFVIYFKIYKYLWLEFVPDNTMTEVLAAFLIIIIIMPLALISTHKLIGFIKNNN